jgi:hypothetical protein
LSFGLLVSIAALCVGIIGIAFGGINQAASRRKRIQDKRQTDFRKAREHLKRHRGDLAKLAVYSQSDLQCDPDIPLLTPQGWIPRRPLLLAEVSLALSGPTKEQLQALELARSKLLSYWPFDSSGSALPSYSKAIVEFDKSTRLEDQPCYRLVGIAPDDPQSEKGQTLSFTRGTYFDGIDTVEPLAYEVALRDLQKSGQIFEGPYRRWLTDPFNLERRAALPGISTLTVRLSKTGPRFFMHRRGLDAGLSMGVFHVAPAGEFQPQIDDPTIWGSDLNILNNIIREYTEEFLGVAEASGHGGAVIDFERDEPYSKFMKAFRSGGISVFYLGTGIDPVSWKPEILTACIFEERTFDEIFANMVTDKIDEGTGGVLLAGNTREIGGKAGRTYSGLAFSPENIAAFADPARTLPSGVACLILVERWMSEIIG